MKSIARARVARVRRQAGAGSREGSIASRAAEWRARAASPPRARWPRPQPFAHADWAGACGAARDHVGRYHRVPRGASAARRRCGGGAAAVLDNSRMFPRRTGIARATACRAVTLSHPLVTRARTARRLRALTSGDEPDPLVRAQHAACGIGVGENGSTYLELQNHCALQLGIQEIPHQRADSAEDEPPRGRILVIQPGFWKVVDQIEFGDR